MQLTNTLHTAYSESVARKGRTGSNPVPGAKSTVRNPHYIMGMRVAGKGNGGNSNNSIYTIARKDRDIYNMESRLRYWLERVSSLSEHDRNDIMRLVQYLQDRETSALRIVRCLNVLMIARRVIGKDLRECTSSDVRGFVAYMEEKGYSPESQSHTVQY